MTGAREEHLPPRPVIETSMGTSQQTSLLDLFGTIKERAKQPESKPVVVIQPMTTFKKGQVSTEDFKSFIKRHKTMTPAQKEVLEKSIVTGQYFYVFQGEETQWVGFTPHTPEVGMTYWHDSTIPDMITHGLLKEAAYRHAGWEHVILYTDAFSTEQERPDVDRVKEVEGRKIAVSTTFQETVETLIKTSLKSKGDGAAVWCPSQKCIMIKRRPDSQGRVRLNMNDAGAVFTWDINLPGTNYDTVLSVDYAFCLRFILYGLSDPDFITGLAEAYTQASAEYALFML